MAIEYEKRKAAGLRHKSQYACLIMMEAHFASLISWHRLSVTECLSAVPALLSKWKIGSPAAL
jgi:hypothetical protein